MNFAKNKINDYILKRHLAFKMKIRLRKVEHYLFPLLGLIRLGFVVKAWIEFHLAKAWKWIQALILRVGNWVWKAKANWISSWDCPLKNIKFLKKGQNKN